MTTKPLVLILCTGNSCRSHLAEGILRATAGDLIEVASAGSKPAGYVHPKSIEVLNEIGIDISGHHSKHMDDPAHATGNDEEILKEFRRVRDQIRLVFDAYAAGLKRGKDL